jgi:hypothetical protein
MDKEGDKLNVDKRRVDKPPLAIKASKKIEPLQDSMRFFSLIEHGV